MARREELVMALSPARGAAIALDRRRYELYRAAILEELSDEPAGVALQTLAEAVEARLRVSQRALPERWRWWVMTVKLDLEARGMIERLPDARPERLRLTGGAAAAQWAGTQRLSRV